MPVVANVLVLAVAAIHVYILVLEMFLWRTERGRRSFGTDQAFADQSATLAANQGLYNGILAAGLAWGVIAPDPVGFQVKLFFLAAVAIAGIYGAATVNRRILFVQTVPAGHRPRRGAARALGPAGSITLPSLGRARTGLPAPLPDRRTGDCRPDQRSEDQAPRERRGSMIVTRHDVGCMAESREDQIASLTGLPSGGSGRGSTRSRRTRSRPMPPSTRV